MAKNRKRKNAKPVITRKKEEVQEEKFRLFFKKLRNILYAAGIPEVYDMLPYNDKIAMCLSRIKGVKVEPAEGCKTYPGLLKHCKKITSDFLNNETMTLIPDGKEVTYWDMATTGLTLQYFAYIKIEDGSYKDNPELTEKLKSFINPLKEGNTLHRNINILGQSISNTISMINDQYYWCTYNQEGYSIKSPDGMDNTLHLHSTPAESKIIVIDGLHRPAYRIGIGVLNKGVNWTSLTPESLGIKTNLSGLKFDVYIQSHALNRLFERVNCYSKGLIQFHLCISLWEIKICKNSKGLSLIEYHFDDIKIGYFTYDIIGNMVILRTFLFITNNNTPEGEKLAEIIGLDKKDKEYLKIDKMSTFLDHNFKEDPILKEIFIKAGCSDLFKSKEEIDIDPEAAPSTSSIHKYLELDKKEQEEIVNFNEA